MFTLAAGKAKVVDALDNLMLATEGRVILIDGPVAAAVLVGQLLNTPVGLSVGETR